MNTNEDDSARAFMLDEVTYLRTEVEAVKHELWVRTNQLELWKDMAAAAENLIAKLDPQPSPVYGEPTVSPESEADGAQTRSSSTRGSLIPEEFWDQYDVCSLHVDRAHSQTLVVRVEPSGRTAAEVNNLREELKDATGMEVYLLFDGYPGTEDEE